MQIGAILKTITAPTICCSYTSETKLNYSHHSCFYKIKHNLIPMFNLIYLLWNAFGVLKLSFLFLTSNVDLILDKYFSTWYIIHDLNIWCLIENRMQHAVESHEMKFNLCCFFDWFDVGFFVFEWDLEI